MRNGEVVLVTPTTSTTAYAANDVVGGKLSLGGALRAAGSVSVLQALSIVDRGNQKAALTVLLFDDDPATSTLTNDAQATFTAADIGKVAHKIDIAGSDYVTVDHAGTDFAVAEISAISKLLKGAVLNLTSGLYAVVYTTGTPTYGVTNGLTFRFDFMYL
jgi:hypothetical protein